MKIKTLIFAFTIILLTSCKTTTNTITYFQDLDNQSTAVTGKAVNYTPRIAPDDQLSITVSGMDPNAVAAFNIPLASYLAPGKHMLLLHRCFIHIWLIRMEKLIFRYSENYRLPA